jgi:hypothetical protein
VSPSAMLIAVASSASTALASARIASSRGCSCISAMRASVGRQLDVGTTVLVSPSIVICNSVASARNVRSSDCTRSMSSAALPAARATASDSLPWASTA